MIDRTVKRFQVPDSYFGRQDRCVPVVMPEHAEKSKLRDYAVPVEEYIAEQLSFTVEDDLLVLKESGGLRYDGEVGLVIPPKYDKPVSRPKDDIRVYSWKGFTAWAMGGNDKVMQDYIAGFGVVPPASRSETKPFAWLNDLMDDFIRNPDVRALQHRMAALYRQNEGKIPKGQLWQPCEVRGCDGEPVCMNCMKCQAIHCRCFDKKGGSQKR